MKNLTREEAIKLHREQWNWLAKNPTKTKKDFLEYKNIQYYEWPPHECFACEYAYKVLKITGGDTFFDRCQYCPFLWPGKNCIFFKKYNDKKGLFSKYRHASAYLSEKAYFAELIANLPERPIQEGEKVEKKEDVVLKIGSVVKISYKGEKELGSYISVLLRINYEECKLFNISSSEKGEFLNRYTDVKIKEPISLNQLQKQLNSESTFLIKKLEYMGELVPCIKGWTTYPMMLQKKGEGNAK